ncbi:MAG: HigA family addiction module antitoxin [Alphaproteobacteria bacterium]|jgi:addiction module HigA family antidote
MLQHAVHPGEVLKEELSEIGVSPTELARQIDVPANRMSQIINGKRAVTGDTALRLGHWFKTDPQFWMNLQAQFELLAAQKIVGKRIRKLPTIASEASTPL